VLATPLPAVHTRCAVSFVYSDQSVPAGQDRQRRKSSRPLALQTAASYACSPHCCSTGGSSNSRPALTKSPRQIGSLPNGVMVEHPDSAKLRVAHNHSGEPHDYCSLANKAPGLATFATPARTAPPREGTAGQHKTDGENECLAHGAEKARSPLRRGTACFGYVA
jgi:hypothetical protein